MHGCRHLQEDDQHKPQGPLQPATKLVVTLSYAPSEFLFTPFLVGRTGRRYRVWPVLHTLLDLDTVLAELRSEGLPVEIEEAAAATIEDIRAGDRMFSRYFKLAVSRLTPEQREAMRQSDE